MSEYQINKKIEEIKKSVREERKNILKLESEIKKQARKVDDYDESYQEFVSLSVEVDKLKKSVNQGDQIEKEQIELISKLESELNYLRNNFINDYS